MLVTPDGGAGRAADPPVSVLRWRRAVELALLFVVVPLVLANTSGRLIIPSVLASGGLCLLLLLRDPTFDRTLLWRRSAARPHRRRVVLRALVCCLLLGVGVAVWRPDLLFGFPRRSPIFWAVVMVAYPIVSVYPQELAFRTFFFHRYAALFPSASARVGASALAFGFAHIVLHNVLAVALTLIGGLLFAITYQRSRSTYLVALEHALYGCWLFTVGLGQFFYGGGRS
jgi:uncharacterized protein